MADSTKKVRVDINTEASGDGAGMTVSGLTKVEKAAEKTNSALRDGLDEAAQKLPIVGDAYAALANPAAAAGLAVAGASAVIVDRIRQAVDMADQLQDLSEQYEVSATALQRVGNVAQTAGGSLEAVAGSFNFLTKSSQEALQKGGEMEATFNRLGITLEDLKGKSPEDIFYMVADGVANATDRQRAYNDVLSVAGRSAGSLFATFSMGRKEIEEAGKAFGTFANDADVKRLAAAKDALAQLNNQLTLSAGTFAAQALEIHETTKQYGALSIAAESAEIALKKMGVNADFAATFDKNKESLRGFIQTLSMGLSPLAPKKFEEAILGVAPAANEASKSVGNLAAESKNIDSAPAAALASNLDPVKVAADAAADAVKNLASASSALESAQDRFTRAQFEAMRANVDMLKAQGELTAEQAASAKLNIISKERETAALREQAKIRQQIIDAQFELAHAQVSGNTEAVDAINQQVEALRKLSETLEQTRSAQDATSEAEFQTQLANQREQVEQKISEQKREQESSTANIVAGEQAISEIQAERSSRHRDNPFASAGFNAPVGADQPALRPTTDFASELAPRNTPAASAPAAPALPGGTGGATPGEGTGEIAAAGEEAAKAIRSASAEAALAVKKSGDSAVTGINDIGNNAVVAVGQLGNTVVTNLKAVSTELAKQAARISALENRSS